MRTRLLPTLALLLLVTACQQKPAEPAADVSATTPSPAPAVAITATSLVRTVGQDKIASAPGVGTVAGNAIISTGKAGYLIYGPYAPLKAGQYRAVIDGSIASLTPDGRVTIDVVSGTGKIRHANVDLATASAPGAPLAEFPVSITEDASDIEVRVRVPADAQVSVSGYRIELAN